MLAHELSHIANRDVLIMTLASFFARLAGMLTRGACSSVGATAIAGVGARLGDRDDRLDRDLHLSFIRSGRSPATRVRGRPGAALHRAPEHLMTRFRRSPATSCASRSAPPPGRGDNAFFIIPDERQVVDRRLFATRSPLEKRLENLARVAREMAARSEDWQIPLSSSGATDVSLRRSPSARRARRGLPRRGELQDTRASGVHRAVPDHAGDRARRRGPAVLVGEALSRQARDARARAPRSSARCRSSSSGSA